MSYKDTEAIGKDHSWLILRMKAIVLIQVEKTRAIAHQTKAVHREKPATVFSNHLIHLPARRIGTPFT
jgi:TRAP-type mannitol/chloroaromatic compound transport system permease small subunit